MARSRTDPNFLRHRAAARGLRFVNALTHRAVRVCGLPYLRRGGPVRRLPLRVASALPPLGQWVCCHPAGAALRFRTDSRRLHLRVAFETTERCDRTPQYALSGFDAYVREAGQWRFVKTLFPQADLSRLDDGLQAADGAGTREWMVYFPVRNHVCSIRLGVERGASLRPAARRPVVLFYGSSIVEGGCASRPGLTYPAIIGRELDVDVINFGFGGSALGEPAVARAIAALTLDALVIDYDHNTPSVEHLSATHQPFFETIRRAQPRLPVLLVSSVNCRGAPGYFRRRAEVIRRTYARARQAGDRLVWFLHGGTIFPRSRWWDCTVDGTHPNDYGFRLMADAIGARLRLMLRRPPRGDQRGGA